MCCCVWLAVHIWGMRVVPPCPIESILGKLHSEPGDSPPQQKWWTPLCREQVHVVDRLHRSMLSPLSHTFVIRQLGQPWCLLMSEHSQAPPWTCWKHRPAPLPPTSSWSEYLDEFYSSCTEADHVQHKFLSGYKTCTENMLHKLKQRVETRDAAK